MCIVYLYSKPAYGIYGFAKLDLEPCGNWRVQTAN